jgi:hypothetical protein
MCAAGSTAPSRHAATAIMLATASRCANAVALSSFREAAPPQCWKNSTVVRFASAGMLSTMADTSGSAIFETKPPFK